MIKLIKGLVIIGFSMPYIIVMEIISKPVKRKKTYTKQPSTRMTYIPTYVTRPATREIKRTVVAEC